MLKGKARKVAAAVLRAKKKGSKKSSIAKLTKAFAGMQAPQGQTGLQQIAPQAPTTPVANRADIIARALDMLQRRQAMQSLEQF